MENRKINEIVTKINIWNVLSVILFLTMNVLFVFLASKEVFWYDEAYTVGMIQRSFKDIISITSNDVHTPFYYCVLKAFYMTVGMKSLISTKLFSWLFYVAYLIFGYCVCQKKFGYRVSFFWLLLSTFSPAIIIQTTSSRMYTFGLFWVTVAAYSAYEVFFKETKKKWILFTISTIFAVYTHTFCMIEMVVVYMIFLTYALIKKKYEMLKKGFISGIIVSICFTPWLFVLWKQFSRWAGWEEGWGNTIAPVGKDSFYTYLAEWFSSLERPQNFAIYFGVLFCIISGVFAIRYIKKTKKYGIAMGIIIASVVFIVALAISVFVVPCFLGRYLIPLFGLIFIFFAVGFNEIPYKSLQVVLGIMLIVIGGGTCVSEWQLEKEDGLNVYRTCIEEEWEEGDMIMADTYFQLMMSIYYPEKEYMVYGSMPNCIPFNRVEVFTNWEQLEDVDTVFYLCFDDFQVGNLDAEYYCIQEWKFTFSYYNMTLKKYVKYQ